MNGNRKIIIFAVSIFIFSIMAYLIANLLQDKALNDYQCVNCNVIIILVDALRADHLGVYGYPRDITPNIDRLSEEGIVFKNAFAQSSWTRPSTASILTGLYPKNHMANTCQNHLNDNALLISEILKDKGYNTYAFVTNPHVGSAIGFNQGYDYFFESNDNVSLGAMPSDELNKKIFDVIDSMNSSDKNFIYIHYMDSHHPYTPSIKEYSVLNNISFDNDFFIKGKFSHFSEADRPDVLNQMVDAYDDEILFNDFQIGLLLERLKERGIYQNSVVVVVSDHGEEFFEHNNLLHGVTLFDESIHVPLIINSPGWKSQVYDELVSQIDVMPTLLHILGFDVPDVDGEVILPPKVERLVYSELDLEGHKISSIRTKDTKFIAQQLSPQVEIDPNNVSFRWFRHYAALGVNATRIELPILSFRIPRSIRVTVDGITLEDVEVSADETYLLNISFSEQDVHSLNLTSLSPCDRPIDYGVNSDIRCLSFMIFNGSVDINEFEEIWPMYYMYFDLQAASSEKNNLYYVEPDKIADKMNELERYTADVRNSGWVSKEVNYTESMEAQLRALGYMN